MIPFLIFFIIIIFIILILFYFFLTYYSIYHLIYHFIHYHSIYSSNYYPCYCSCLHYIVIIYKPWRAPNKHEPCRFNYNYFEDKITFYLLLECYFVFKIIVFKQTWFVFVRHSSGFINYDYIMKIRTVTRIIITAINRMIMNKMIY